MIFCRTQKFDAVDDNFIHTFTETAFMKLQDFMHLKD